MPHIYLNEGIEQNPNYFAKLKKTSWMARVFIILSLIFREILK